jgi:hypothetical protein
MVKAAPLPGTTMIIGILGSAAVLLFSSYGRLSPPFAFISLLFFVMLFIASLISMAHSPLEAQVGIDEQHHLKEKLE